LGLAFCGVEDFFRGLHHHTNIAVVLFAMGNWWLDSQGRNNLAGIPGDATNPAVLPDYLIVDLLIRNQRAKEDFLAMLPSMTADEQVRLNALTDANPATLLPFPFNDQAVEDQFMHTLNSRGFRDPNRKR